MIKVFAIRFGSVLEKTLFDPNQSVLLTSFSIRFFVG